MLSYTVNETQRLVPESSVPEENLKGGKRPQQDVNNEETIEIQDEEPPTKKQTPVTKKASGMLKNNIQQASTSNDKPISNLEAEKVKEQTRKILKEKLDRVREKLRLQEEENQRRRTMPIARPKVHRPAMKLSPGKKRPTVTEECVSTEISTLTENT